MRGHARHGCACDSGICPESCDFATSKTRPPVPGTSYLVLQLAALIWGFVLKGSPRGQALLSTTKACWLSPVARSCDAAKRATFLPFRAHPYLRELGSAWLATTTPCQRILNGPGSSTSEILGNLLFCISTSWHAQSLLRIDDHGQEETPNTPDL